MKYVQPKLLYQHFKRTAPKPGRLLGLNVCSNSIGVAASDKPYILPSYVGVIPKDSADLLVKKLEEWIPKYSVKGLVFGCFADVCGHPLPESLPVLRFVQDLSKIRELEDMKYTYWDNALSETICGGKHESYLYRKERDKKRVHIGTSVILQDYFYRMEKHSDGYRHKKSCSEVLNEFTENCTITALCPPECRGCISCDSQW